MLFYVDIYALELFAILFDRSVNPLSWANVVVSNALVLIERINPILLMTTSVYQKFRLTRWLPRHPYSGVSKVSGRAT